MVFLVGLDCRQSSRRKAVLVLTAAALGIGPGCDGPRAPVADTRYATVGREEAAHTQGATCPYLPSFAELRERVEHMDPVAPVSALTAYATENPDACQSMALDAAIATREQALVTLRLADGRSIPAHTSYRCDIVASGTTACRGTVEDATAHPYSVGVFRDGAGPLALSGPTTATIASALPGAKLEAVYRLNVADLLDGGHAKRLPTGNPVTLAPDKALMAVIAIFSAPHGWKRHKLVWYYGLNISSPPAASA